MLRCAALVLRVFPPGESRHCMAHCCPAPPGTSPRCRPRAAAPADAALTFAACFTSVWLAITVSQLSGSLWCRSAVPPGKDELLLAGLNLLRLLVQNRIAEFHTELELLPHEVHPPPFPRPPFPMRSAKGSSSRAAGPFDSVFWFADP